ncbi:MAG: hypothetical protein ACYTAO_17585, partial [Planctomycetota bacterium]
SLRFVSAVFGPRRRGPGMAETIVKDEAALVAMGIESGRVPKIGNRAQLPMICRSELASVCRMAGLEPDRTCGL